MAKLILQQLQRQLFFKKKQKKNLLLLFVFFSPFLCCVIDWAINIMMYTLPTTSFSTSSRASTRGGTRPDHVADQESTHSTKQTLPSNSSHLFFEHECKNQLNVEQSGRSDCTPRRRKGPRLSWQAMKKKKKWNQSFANRMKHSNDPREETAF